MFHKSDSFNIMKKQYIVPTACYYSVCGNTDLLQGFNLGGPSKTAKANWFQAREREDMGDDLFSAPNASDDEDKNVDWDF